MDVRGPVPPPVPDPAPSPDVAARIAELAALDDAADTATVRRIYDEWAPTYDDEDVAAVLGYPSPERVAERVASLVRPDTDVLDVACGTGLVGAALAARGFRSLDGLDVSPAMIRRARRRRVYHDLGPADLRREVPGAAAKFGVVTCVGALGPGHLGPPALGGLVRVLRPGGLLVVATTDEIWAAGPYEAAVRRLVDGGHVRPHDGDQDDGHVDEGPGRLVVLTAREVPGPGRSVAWWS
ncbi:class I SAM-dependent DNA methyltransferase [Actinomycetospora lemnae]|uniref:Class I SAM-dependent methyltransferase n=1 Tax=Actinomycetospora lemnae TaxID=3019891 RepID=A0ABT5SRP2_9PSEU|nr:class I SAM-dependent methyltransferase [Actinomycetospora sp. DW7H6]MDD7964816.1 class I SAM-dependent methyltransferase [Actinomycetospora sp. DW7H6]